MSLATVEHMKAKIVLGKEYDTELEDTLVAVLKSEGAKLISKIGGVPGADFCDYTLDVNGEIITVVSETYMGLSIEGEKDVIERLAKLIAASKDEKSKVRASANSSATSH
jgi:hypothetical protein